MDFSKLQLLIYDCDGVLTDNRVLVSEDGKEYAIFHRGDGTSVRMLRELGIPQAIISTEANPIVEHRARKLKMDALHDVEDKKTALVQYCRDVGVPLECVMYIGNDLNDYEAMMSVGMRGCPHDAEPEIQAICQWVSTKDGGQGVIRELYRLIAKGQKEKQR